MSGHNHRKSDKLYKLDREGCIVEKYTDATGLPKEDGCYISHLPAHTNIEDCKVITMFRHPKNILVSHVRWILQNPDTKKYKAIENLSVEKQLIYILTDLYKDFYLEMSSYSGWWRKGPCLRFEEVYHDPKYYFYAVGQLLGQRSTYPGTDLIFSDSMTYNNKMSYWREWFTPRVETVFKKVGGLDLMQEWGYAV